MIKHIFILAIAIASLGIGITTTTIGQVFAQGNDLGGCLDAQHTGNDNPSAASQPDHVLGENGGSHCVNS